MPNLIHFKLFSSRFVLNIVSVLILLTSNYPSIISSVYAQERVYTYSSIIKVLPNRSLDVTETITVYVENKKIRHGIYRDFETSRINQDNKKVNVDLKIIEVKRNGVREKFHTRQQGNKIRVFFGSKDKIVSKGIQTYEFRFITNNQLNSYENRDEFYWNASGNKWSMPIFRVEATVILPPQVKKKTISYNAYSGYTGVNKQDYISSFSNNHTIKFALNKKYLAGNGLTIAISWPKGFIDPVSSMQSDSLITQNKAASNNLTINKKTNITEQNTITDSRAEIINRSVESAPTNSSNTQIAQQDTTNKNILADKKIITEQIIKPKIAEQPNLFQKVISKIIEKSSLLTFNNLIGITGLIILIFYFLLVRLFLKKNSITVKNGTSDYSENIPNNLSPASIRYIYEMGYDDRTFAIALINIAVKGHIDIINNGKIYKIERRDFSAADKLSEDEALLLNTLMGNETAIQLISKNHRIIRDAMTKHHNLLEKDHKKKYFATNKKWFNLGVAIVGATLMTLAFTEYTLPKALLTFIIITVFTFASFILNYALLKLFDFYNNFEISFISNSTFFISMRNSKEAYLFAILAIESSMVIFLMSYLDMVNIITLYLASLVCAIFSDYLISPNSEGKNLINKIVNLKEFITHGELLDTDSKYDSIQISQKISAFDNYLPYTIALGVETEWGDHYSLMFNNNNNTDDLPGYSPHWYHGCGWKENNTTDFCESLSSNFSFSAASAAKKPQYDFENDHSQIGLKH
jgi:energy-converting hydrogenase Eha subunit E